MANTPELTRLDATKSTRVYHLGDLSGATEVWFALHGFGQLAAQFIQDFAPAVRPGRVVVAPEGLNHFYTDHRGKKVGATWMTSEDRDAEIRDYVKYLDEVGERFLAGLVSPRVEVHGFSQGSATAARWVSLGRIRAARLVIWGGEMPPDPPVESVVERLNAADLHLVMGDKDQYYNRDRVDQGLERLDAAGVRYTMHWFEGGHVVDRGVLGSLGSP
jgi:predicted esterase